MIVLRAVRVEDDGAETELGEIRLTEVGAVFAHSSTSEGGAVIADLVERQRAVYTPLTLDQIREAERARRLGEPRTDRGEA